MRRLALTAALAAALFGATPAAIAAPKETDAVEDAAKARYSEGLKLFSKKKYEQARAAFVQAYALKKSPNTLLMLAQVYVKLGRALDALKFYDAYLQQVPEPTEKNRSIIENGRKEARAMLGQIKVNAPDGAEVSVDDEARGKAPLKGAIDVMPGAHTVKITLGDDEKVEKVELQAGTSIEISPKFAPKPSVGVPAPAKPKAPTPLPPAPVKEGESPGLLSPPATEWPVYAAAVVGMGGMTIAAISGGLKYNADYAVSSANGALNRAGTTRARCAQPTVGTEFQEVCDNIAKNEGISNDMAPILTTSLIVGGIGFGIALVYYLVAPKERAQEAEPKSDSRAPRGRSFGSTPWLAPGVGGTTFSARF